MNDAAPTGINPPVYRHEFHGGQHDGLVLLNKRLHLTVYVPMDRPVKNGEEYDAWTPTEGQEVGVYVYRRHAVREDGNTYYHLYLTGVETLVVKP